MLEGDNIRVQNVKGLTDIELEKIKAFLQGAVCCWCLSHKGKWFMAKDLIADHKWENYPLDVLRSRYKNQGKDDKYAFDQASQDAGKILKKVLLEDEQIFETKKERDRDDRQYRLK